MSETKADKTADAKPAQVTVEHPNGEVRVIPTELLEDFTARGFTASK